jgi:hypothetical protein
MLGAGAGGCQTSTSITRSRVAQLNMIHSVLTRPLEVPGVKIGTTCLTDTSIHIPVQDAVESVLYLVLFCVAVSAFSLAFSLTFLLLSVYSTIVAGNGSRSLSSGLLLAAVAVAPDHICAWMERLCMFVYSACFIVWNLVAYCAPVQRLDH